MPDGSPYVLQRGAVLQRGGADPLAGLQMNSEPIPFAALSYGSQRVIVDSGVSMRPGVMALTRTGANSSARARARAWPSASRSRGGGAMADFRR
jgi:hypothetical protein